jgi:uncharacterized protein
MTVAILGASANPDKFAYAALRSLLALGHTVFPVNPALTTIGGMPAYHRLGDVPAAIDTITVYLSAGRSDPLRDDIIAVRPRRVIFNPGTENPALEKALRETGIEAKDACTLAMLAMDIF